MNGDPRIFISYSRQDGATAAAEIRDRLAAEGLSLWQDLVAMEGGRDWWRQIEEAITKAEYLVLLLTPKALESEVCAKEWRYARQQGTYVIPVCDGPPGALELDLLPAWMRNADIIDRTIPERWTWFVGKLRLPFEVRRVRNMAEALPTDYVARPTEFDRLKCELLNPRTKGAVAITVALKGAGGYGKTTLARALCADADIQEAYYDGILWVTLGETPGDLLGRVEDLIKFISNERPGYSTLEIACAQLEELLAERRMLIVIDDVWTAADTRAFLRGGLHCARLLTTRDSATLPRNAAEQPVDKMRGDEAVALLRAGLPPGEDEMLRQLAARLGGWPLLLKLANGALVDRVARSKAPLRETVAHATKLLDRRGLTAFDPRETEDRRGAVAKTLELSLDRLDSAEQARLSELAVFPEDAQVPVATVELLWRKTAGLDDIDTEELLQRLHGLSLLLQLDLGRRLLQLHDVIRAWLRDRLGSGLAQVEQSLVGAYRHLCGGDWHRLDDAYALRFLPMHLRAVDERDWGQLLLDPRWMSRKLQATGLGVSALLSDYPAGNDPPLGLLGAALRLSGDALAQAPSQLPAQLAGRLRESGSQAVEELLASATRELAHSVFLPRFQSLATPAGPLIDTRQVPEPLTRPLAVSADGRRWLGGWGTKIPALLDLEDDVTRPIKIDFNYGIYHSAICPHGRYLALVMTVEQGYRLYLYDIEEERSLRVWTMSSHLTSVAVAGGPARLALGYRDGWVRILSVDGQETSASMQQPDPVSAVAIDPPGRRCAFAAGHHVHLWDLETGTSHVIASLPEEYLCAVAVVPNREAVLVGSQTGRLSVETRGEPGASSVLQLGGAWIGCVTVSETGTHGYSASHDGALRRWDLAGPSRSSLPRHESVVYAVAASLDGARYVSGSYLGDLRLTALAGNSPLAECHFHRKGLRSILPVGPGDRCLTYWDDGVFEVLDWSTRSVERSFAGHDDPSPAMAVTPCGKRCVHVHTGGRVDVWDLERCTQPTTLQIANDYGIAKAISANARWAATGSRASVVTVWDVEADRLHRKWSTNYGEPDDIALSDDASVCALLFSNRQMVSFWDVTHVLETYTFLLHSPIGRFGTMTNMSFVGGRDLFAVAVESRTVHLLDLRCRVELASFTADHVVSAIYAVPPSTLIVGDTGGSVHVLDFVDPLPSSPTRV